MLDPQVQAAYLREYGASQQQAQRQQQEETISQLLQSLTTTPQSVGVPSSVSEIPLMNQAQVQPTLPSDKEVELPLERPTSSKVEKKDSILEFSQKQEPDLKKISVPLSPGAQGALELEKLNEQLANPLLSASIKERVRERAEKTQDRYMKQQEKIDESNKEYLNDTKAAFDGAREGDMRLARMKELILKGNLPSPDIAVTIFLTWPFVTNGQYPVPSIGVALNDPKAHPAQFM